MKSTRNVFSLLAMLYLVYLGFLFLSSSHLPERVASHFDADGRPDSWMSRRGHIQFMVVFGTAFPLAVVMVCYLVRFLPDDMIHIPNGDYWLATERRASTLGEIFRHSLWFACLGLGFMAGIHFLILAANTRRPPGLSVPQLLTVTLLFIVGLLWWIVALLHRFRSVERPQPSSPSSIS